MCHINVNSQFNNILAEKIKTNTKRLIFIKLHVSYFLNLSETVAHFPFLEKSGKGIICIDKGLNL